MDFEAAFRAGISRDPLDIVAPSQVGTVCGMGNVVMGQMPSGKDVVPPAINIGRIAPCVVSPIRPQCVNGSSSVAHGQHNSGKRGSLVASWVPGRNMHVISGARRPPKISTTQPTSAYV